ncbi:dolichol-phosphate mannosyltransferase subunit 3 [Gigaspora margarita]|uniref:Dolichol-phosphate mannosyltransferase subunit 3 n=1 Tax=Gigaspora margarita TaxID=4874 RepID=A0A8H3XMY1_GIGMA|nr:dolichol-phosphate mannosyltransferase subunit 3 [Gigaspora margarita]
MSRATETASFLGIISVIYFLSFFGIIPLPQIFREEILPVLPWWALVSFGSYSLGNIGYHLYRFRDCDDAYHELMEEIQSAKDDLRTKGVSVD